MFDANPTLIGRILPIVIAAIFLYALVVLAGIPIRYNIRNLIVRWPTALLTGLAFTSVIALLTVMLAFVKGMYDLTEASGHDDNVIILSDGATDEAFSNLGFGDVGDIANQAVVKRENGVPLCSRETYFVVVQPIANPKPGEPKRRFLQMRGIDDPAVSSLVHQLQLHDGGRWFSEAGVRKLAGAEAAAAPAIEVVLGEGIARQLGEDRLPAEIAKAKNKERLDTGDTFSLGERKWVVAGVMKSSGSTFDSEVWAKRAILGPMFGKKTYTSLVLKTSSPDDALKAKNFFNQDYEKASVQALTEKEYFAKLSETNMQFLVGIIIVTAIMAFGGAMGIMNTMFAAVSQRQKDIGVLRLLGFTRWQISTSFVVESLALALVGGLAGCALGMLADGVTATSIVSGGQGGGKFVVLRLSVDARILTLGIVLSLAMGAIGGLIPALKSMWLRPLEALR
jgi:putative ABC transport system permease protein